MWFTKFISGALLLFSLPLASQNVCNGNNNLMIYSNYDGGIVTINVDADIPDLKIGICTYEPVQVTITGTFVANVTRVVYAGFNSNQGNNNCGLGDFPTSISGVNASIVEILTSPAATLANPNGWPDIIGAAGNCNASQSTGGVNTADQIVDFFQQYTGSTLYGHFTQYNCWLSTNYFISQGGNCCLLPETNCIPPIVNAGLNQSICEGNSVQLGGNPTASGGSDNNYIYTWTPATDLSTTNSPNPTANPEITTTYFLTVSTSDVNCSSSASVTINVGQTQDLNVEVNGTLSLCPNESLELIAESGFTNYTWSNGQNQNTIQIEQAGQYSVTALSSNGCEAVSDTFIVTLSAPFEVEITPNNIFTSCASNPIELTAQEGFTNYVWSNSQTGQSISILQTGLYSVSATNSSGCTGSSQLVGIEVIPNPIATFTYVQINEYNVQFTNTSIGITSSFWNFGMNNTSTELNPLYDFPFDNTWPVSLIVENECGFDTLNSSVTVIKTNVYELQSGKIKIIPTSEGIRFVLNNAIPEKITIQVHALNGQLIQSRKLNLQHDELLVFDNEELSRGMYMISVLSATDQFQYKWVR